MGHLSTEQFVDLAEGMRAESSFPHLQACATCREQLEALRSMMSAAADIEVPEPSPLFWDRVSARVREAVAASGPPRRAWWHLSTWPRVAIPVVTAVVVVIAVGTMLTPRVQAPTAPSFVSVPAPGPSVAAADSIDDPALGLVQELAAQMDWEDASQLAVATHPGLADEAFSELTQAERLEMRQLLQDLAKPGI